MTTLKQVLLRTYKDRAILEEKLAKQGGSPDLRLINMIEDHQTAIALIEEALTTELTDSGLKRLKEDLRPLLINDRIIDQIEIDKIVVPLPFEPEMVLIESGPFLMGSPAGEGIPEEETPRHEVTLPAFEIGRYPITNAQYAEFIKQVPQQEIPKKAGWFLREPPADKLDHPVVGVSWHEAKAYCDWLTNRTGRPYRLPTEAEWEKAASWTGQAQQSYPWGDVFDSLKANTHEGSHNDTTPVGAFSPQGDSPSGCADMAGNVQEWTSTLWGMDLNKCDYPYPYRVNDGREDPAAVQRLHRVYYIHRGGSYRDDQTKVRCSLRGYSDPDSKIKWRGFRVVLEV